MVFRQPRSGTPKGLASFGKRQILRAREELVFIAGAYGDVDQGIVNDVDEILDQLTRLEDALTTAASEGRGATQ